MITVQNSSNNSKYTALFKEAYAFLKDKASRLETSDPERYGALQTFFAEKDAAMGDEAAFTSVQEYFSHLKDIYDLGGEKFLMLPLDEPVFEINANTRDITVPAEFKKNGISVQGDEIAESLIFRINRFFDYADLASEDMVCQIQWQNANKEKEEGISDAFVVDDSKSADYLYIMWPLTEKITRYPGTIKFSVRCYKKSGSELVYSFSTKIAQATINQGHDFDVENWSAEIDNASRSFKNAIINSKNTAVEDAISPFFILDLNQLSPAGEQGKENADYMDDKVCEAYIDAVDNPVQTLKAEAAIEGDTGFVRYEWTYTDTLSNPVKVYDLVPETKYEAIQAGETKVANKIYYKEDASTASGYSPIAFEDAENLPLFEKYSVVEVKNGHEGKATGADDPAPLDHVVGLYQVKAITTKNGASSSPTGSVIVNFPKPEVLEFAEGGNLDANYFLAAGTNQGSIEVEPIIDERGAKASYIWCYGDTATGPWHPIFGPTSSLTQEEKETYYVLNEAGSTTGLNIDEPGRVLTINNRPGYYKVIVVSTRNYSEKKLASGVCKVTKSLAKPQITAPTAPVSMTSLYGAVQLAVTVTDMDNEFDSEGITFQWHKYNNGVPEPIEGATDSTFTVDRYDKGDYACLVTNHMGEFVAEQMSAPFNIGTYPTNTPDPEPETPVNTDPEPDVEGMDISFAKIDGVTPNDALINFTNDVLTVSVDLDAIEEVDGHKHVPIDVILDGPITGYSFDGVALTADDVAAATEKGLGEGHYVYDALADTLTTGKQIEIRKLNTDLVETITVLFEDTVG